jgi:16S rRNA (cytosine967-C5)-methyltransferase
VTRRAISGERDPWVKRHAGGFDRVLVDAPCGGSGTWRRNPDAKWRFSREDLGEVVALQERILASAARLVRPGGRLVYATCSLLPVENQEQVGKFLAGAPDFSSLAIEQVWGEANPTTPCPTLGPWLSLTPASHGTDGFFVAVMQRAAAPAKT